MNRCLILIASGFLTVAMISSATSVNASDWTSVAHGASLGDAALGGTDQAAGTSIAPWATIPSARMFDFVEVCL